MSEYTIKKATFKTSVGTGTGEYPKGLQIALVGRSNVGKSSLINTVCGRNKLARISSSPGKTRLINFFDINDGEFFLVDLPGYGYAEASKGEQAKWAELIEAYLSSGSVTHIFMLIDIRHEPTAADRQMLQWIIYYNVPYTLIATKSDKLARSKRRTAANTAAKQLGAPPYALPFSAETGEGKQEMLERIGNILADFGQGSQKEADTGKSLLT